MSGVMLMIWEKPVWFSFDFLDVSLDSTASNMGGSLFPICSTLSLIWGCYDISAEVRERKLYILISLLRFNGFLRYDYTDGTGNILYVCIYTHTFICMYVNFALAINYVNVY